MKDKATPLLVALGVGLLFLQAQEGMAQSHASRNRQEGRGVAAERKRALERAAPSEEDLFVDRDGNGWNDSREQRWEVRRRPRETTQDTTHDYFIDQDRDGFSDRWKSGRKRRAWFRSKAE